MSGIIVHPRPKKKRQQLGPHLRRVRKQKKLSIREVCRRAKIQHTTLSRIEAGTLRQMPDIETLTKISKVLGLEFEDLVRRGSKDFTRRNK